MKAYRINLVDAVEYAGTKDEAHTIVKEQSKHEWPEITVDEVDVQVDKAGVIHALNGSPIVSEPLRTWGVTARGGLKEEK